MKNKKYNIGSKLQVLFLFVFCLFLHIGEIRAEGSKDLYTENAKGGRAYLRATNRVASQFPFSNNGEHFVYAVEGEVIALASDAQIGTVKKISLYAPNGSEVTPARNNVNTGNIPNRAAELAGPGLPGQARNNNEYEAIYYTVPVGGSGIYRVTFLGNARTPDTDYLGYGYSPAIAWPTAMTSNYLIAWDISVARQIGGTWNWLKGRVFTTQMTMFNASYPHNTSPTFLPNSGFYGKFIVLTKDGYVYKVDNNGNQGMAFTFMVNNQGFHKVGDPKTSSYQSIPASTAAQVQNRYHDPRKADTDFVTTQKIFYNLPDSTMPEEAVGALAGGKTWLRVQEKKLNVDDIRVEGAEGSLNQVGNKGAYIKFTNEIDGNYYITISPKPGNYFKERLIQGPTIIGENTIFWDGKDGDGLVISPGLVDLNVDLKLRGAEVHFPYLDIELNEFGIIIELLSTDLQSVRSDIVFWDDTLIGNGGGSMGSKSNPRNASHTVLPEGTSSNLNGHIWGLGSNNTNGTFGDNQGIDTWTFIKGDAISVGIDVDIKVADLEVVSVVPDKTILHKNEEIIYTVKVKNNGPSDVKDAVFTFDIPSGFDPVRATFIATTCGTESQVIAYDSTNYAYTSKLDLLNGCEITYEITMKAISPILGTIAVEAATLRPKDVVDPDATNTDPLVPPTNAQYECDHNGLGVPCNNIKTNTEVKYSDAAFILIKDGRFNDDDSNGSAQAGETLTYILNVTNTGRAKIEDIVVSDPLLGGVVTVNPVKSKNTDAVLDADETWTYTLTYTLTPADIQNEGVYNQAKVEGKDSITGEIIEISSIPTVPLTPGDLGYDPTRPNHTFVPLIVGKILISNPMIRQRMK